MLVAGVSRVSGAAISFLYNLCTMLPKCIKILMWPSQKYLRLKKLFLHYQAWTQSDSPELILKESGLEDILNRKSA